MTPLDNYDLCVTFFICLGILMLGAGVINRKSW